MNIVSPQPAVLCLILCFSQCIPAWSHPPLTAPERDLALQLEQKAVTAETQQFRTAPAIRDTANSVTSGPEYVTGVSAMPPVADPTGGRIAKVTRYQYAGGITVHTFVDLDAGKVLSVTPYTNFPTPFSDEETSRAKELAIEQVPEIAETIFRQRGTDLQVDILTLTNSDPNSPDYGHRTGKLHYRTPEGREVGIPPVHVDLTTGKAHSL